MQGSASGADNGDPPRLHAAMEGRGATEHGWDDNEGRDIGEARGAKGAVDASVLVPLLEEVRRVAEQSASSVQSLTNEVRELRAMVMRNQRPCPPPAHPSSHAHEPGSVPYTLSSAGVAPPPAGAVVHKRRTSSPANVMGSSLDHAPAVLDAEGSSSTSSSFHQEPSLFPAPPQPRRSGSGSLGQHHPHHHWVRLFSKEAQAYFFFDMMNNEVYPECVELNYEWEKVFVPQRGRYVYLNAARGEVEMEDPMELAERTAKEDVKEAKEAEARARDAGAGWKAGGVEGTVKHRTQFGSDSRIRAVGHPRLSAEKQHKVRRASHPWMLDPNSPQRVAWDVVILLPLLLYLAVVMPVEVGFGVGNNAGALLIMELVVDAAFVVDVFVNFRTGFTTRSGDVEYDNWLVARRYLMSWFLVDAASGLPFTLFTVSQLSDSLGSLQALKLLKLARAFRALRLVRVLRLNKLMQESKLLVALLDHEALEEVQDFMSDNAVRRTSRSLKVLVEIAYVCHLACCAWVFVGRVGSQRGMDNWLAYTNDWVEYDGWTRKDTAGGTDMGSIYLASVYFCFTTLTSVGYGDITPRNNMERIFSILLQGVGGALYAMIIAYLTTAMMSKDANHRLMSERLAAVSSYVKNRRFPKPLARQVRRYFRMYYEQKTAIDERQILKDLSTPLRTKVSAFLVSEHMEKIPIFCRLSRDFWARLLPLLRPVEFNPGEFICCQGDEVSDMLIVLSGKLMGCTVADDSAVQLLRDDALAEAEEAEGAESSTLFSFGSRKRSMFNIGLGTVSSASFLEHKKPSFSEEVKADVPPPPPPFTSSSSSSSSSSFAKRYRFLEPFTRKTGGDVHSVDAGVERLELASMEGGDVELSSPPSPPKLGMEASEFASKEPIRREIGMYDIINVLCILKIWSQAVETVKAVSHVKCYAVNADDFYEIMEKNKEVLKEMCDFTTETMFHMLKTAADAPTKYGVPLYVLPKELAQEREEEYELRRMRMRGRQQSSRADSIRKARRESYHYERARRHRSMTPTREAPQHGKGGGTGAGRSMPLRSSSYSETGAGSEHVRHISSTRELEL